MKRMIIAIAITLALSACGNNPKLVILHCNDTHSHFEAMRAGELAGHGGVIERAAFVDSIRNAYGEDRVLLLHAGDFSQGSSYFTELGGQLEPRVINDFRYDCVTLGNHEFDNGIEDLAQRLSMLEDTRVVCANLDLSPLEAGRYVTPYAIIQRGGMKVGVIGLVSDLMSNVSRTISSRIQQLDDVEVVNKWAALLKNTEMCDLVILLSHIGYDMDQELVPQVSNIDLVIGGHSHTFVKDLLYVRDATGKKVPIVSDGNWGLEMGKIEVK